MSTQSHNPAYIAEVAENLAKAQSFDPWSAKWISAAHVLLRSLAAREADAVPVAWMIRDQHGEIYWDETSCVFSSEKSADDEASGLYDGDGQDWESFPLYAAPVAQEAAAPAEQVVGDGVVVAYRYRAPEHEGAWTAILSHARASALRADGFIVEPLVVHHSVSSAVTVAEYFSALQTTSDLSDRYRAVMEAQGGGTDDVRVPLHEVWADVDGLIARVEQGTLSRAEVVSVIRRKIDTAYAALAAHPHTGYSAVPEGWLPIDTAPNDGTMHVRGLHVYGPDGAFLYWDAITGYVDSEDGVFFDMGGDVVGWDAADFTHWHPLAAAPEVGRG